MLITNEHEHSIFIFSPNQGCLCNYIYNKVDPFYFCINIILYVLTAQKHRSTITVLQWEKALMSVVLF